jgi:hypothetical protein
VERGATAPLSERRGINPASRCAQAPSPKAGLPFRAPKRFAWTSRGRQAAVERGALPAAAASIFILFAENHPNCLYINNLRKKRASFRSGLIKANQG